MRFPWARALGYCIGGVLGPKYGWRVPFYVGAAPGFLLALLLLFIPEPPLGQFDDALKQTPERDTLKGLVRNPAFLTATFGMAMMTFALGGLQVWMPTFLHRVHGYTSARRPAFCLEHQHHGLMASWRRPWRMAFRSPAAANQGRALLGVGGQPRAGNSGHVHGAFCQRAS